MSEKCLLVCCCKAATTGFTHAAISPGPLVRITISTGLLLTAAVSSCAPLLQLDELMTASSSSSSSSATLPFLVHPLLQPSGLQTQKQKQCAIKLYSWVSCMHHSWYKRAISHSESNKCQITSMPFTIKTRIWQNQEEFLGFSIVPLKA